MDVGLALWRSTITGMTRLASGDLGVKLTVTNEADRALLADETQSWTAKEMPGELDLAFEAALPDSDWPVFAFDVVASAPETAIG